MRRKESATLVDDDKTPADSAWSVRLLNVEGMSGSREALVKGASRRAGSELQTTFSAARFRRLIGLQILVHPCRHLTSFGDGPDDEGGAALGIAAGKDAVEVGHAILI